MGKSSSSKKRRVITNTDDVDDGGDSRKRNKAAMAAEEQRRRLPLSEVVSDCVERWFGDTLKEAKAGDVNMQVLVGQMYSCGYGVLKDANKGKFWITRASRVRSSVWKVCDKRPGYTVSDSDSDSDSDDVASDA